ncbi:hypothetical protein D3C72_1924120 [compost metagenome]
MPKGELRPLRKVLRRSATPSPLMSRSREIRLALGTWEPAFFMNQLATLALMLGGLSVPGAALSATSTSPLGST